MIFLGLVDYFEILEYTIKTHLNAWTSQKYFDFSKKIFFEIIRMLSGKVCKKNKLVSFVPK